MTRDVPSPDSLDYGDLSQDKKSQEEAKKLDLLAAKDRYDREERVRSVIAGGILAIIRAIIFMLLLVIFTVAYHHLTPLDWHWLLPEQQDNLKTIIFSGALVGLVSSYIYKYS